MQGGFFDWASEVVSVSVLMQRRMLRIQVNIWGVGFMMRSLAVVFFLCAQVEDIMAFILSR